MEVCFLIYDSRSGSTILAKKMSEKIDNIVISPEIGFYHLINNFKKYKDIMDKNAFIEYLYNNNYFINITNIKNEIYNSIDLNKVHKFHQKYIIETILMEFLKKHHQLNDVEHIIIKNGEHAFLWPAIMNIFEGKVKFIYIYRDPRAVINSKLKTIRSYFPFENMAWGGSLLSAWRWRQFSKSMRYAREKNIPVLEIRYEDFIEQTDSTIARVAQFLGTNLKERGSETTYLPPENEKGMHELVFSGKIHHDRSLGWKSELNQRDIFIIESLLYEEMQLWNYHPMHPLSLWQRLYNIAFSIPQTMINIFKHYINNYCYKRNNALIK